MLTINGNAALSGCTISHPVHETQAGREVVLLDGLRPVARILPIADDSVSSENIARTVMLGGAFDWLADEPNLYDDTCSAAIPHLLA